MRGCGERGRGARLAGAGDVTNIGSTRIFSNSISGFCVASGFSTSTKFHESGHRHSVILIDSNSIVKSAEGCSSAYDSIRTQAFRFSINYSSTYPFLLSIDLTSSPSPPSSLVSKDSKPFIFSAVDNQTSDVVKSESLKDSWVHRSRAFRLSGTVEPSSNFGFKKPALGNPTVKVLLRRVRIGLTCRSLCRFL
jgi:hypothetical protein